MAQVESNKAEGRLFESLFARQAQIEGLLVIKNHLSCRMLYKGRVQVIPGQLDFTLANRDGRVAYVDCKSFEGFSFSHSKLTPHQVERAALYNDWNIPSGFIVHFRKTGQIVFFRGSVIHKTGPGNSFHSGHGTILGCWHRFDLKPVFLGAAG